MRFSGMAESIGPMWSKQNQTLGRGPTASRWSAPSPGKRTRREDRALLIVRDEFRPAIPRSGCSSVWGHIIHGQNAEGTERIMDRWGPR
jgi:hypothetical protein